MATHRGRKSAAELEALANLTHQRPQPPEHLSEPEREIWTRVVDGLPEDWFPAETHDLLADYCGQVMLARRIQERFMALPDDAPLSDLNKLQLMKDKSTRLLATLATKMRITQQSTYDREKLKRKSPPATDPWSSLQ